MMLINTRSLYLMDWVANRRPDQRFIQQLRSIPDFPVKENPVFYGRDVGAMERQSQEPKGLLYYCSLNERVLILYTSLPQVFVHGLSCRHVY